MSTFGYRGLRWPGINRTWRHRVRPPRQPTQDAAVFFERALLFAGAVLTEPLVFDASAALFAAHLRLVASTILLRPSGLKCLFGADTFSEAVSDTAAAFFAAHLCRVASAILLRPSGLICLFRVAFFEAEGRVSASAWLGLSISRNAAMARSIEAL